MRTYTVIILLLGSIVALQAQEKIKGSRNVIEMSESLSDFSRLEVTDGLDITLIRSGSTGYDLEMDDNLVQLINMDIKDSLLMVSLKKTIRSSKRLNITVRFTQIDEISVDAKSSVSSQSVLETGSFKGTISGNSSLQAEVKSKSATFTIDDNSKLDLDYRGDRLIVNAKDNAFAKADINTETLELVASGRSDLDFIGNANEAIITLDDQAEFKAKTFNADAVKAILRGSSKATLSADKDILIDMGDKSQLNLYGEPAITVDRFSGSAVLQKKEMK